MKPQRTREVFTRDRILVVHLEPDSRDIDQPDSNGVEPGIERAQKSCALKTTTVFHC